MSDDAKPPEDDRADADACYQASKDLDRQDLLLLKLIPPVLNELRSIDLEREREPSDRVRFARDRAQVALFERLCRVGRRDLPAHQA